MTNQVTEILNSMAHCDEEIARLRSERSRLATQLHEHIDGEKITGKTFVYPGFVVTIDNAYTMHLDARYKVHRQVPLPVALTLPSPEDTADTL